MRLTRRQLLAGLAATVACSRPGPRRRVVSADRGRAERAHRLLEPLSQLDPVAAGKVDGIIVGAGAAGLSAAWRLARAGFSGQVAHFELDRAAGGTAQASQGPAGPAAWGAHYITMPNAENQHTRAILEDLGVIQGYRAGRPRYASTAICNAPQERVYVAGQWEDGLLGEASQATLEQFGAFQALCDGYRVRMGSDGLPAFSIPLVYSSQDPDLRALANVSFADWLKRGGFDDERLLWWLEYGCRDDFGTRLSDTSAWAGLHYHCARRPDPADARDLGTDVLTWPAGNGFLIDGLQQRSPWPVQLESLVRQVENVPDGVRVWVEQAGIVRRFDAPWVILAVPERVSARLLQQVPMQRVSSAPWLVAQVEVEGPLPSRGVAQAWDSVPMFGDSLGYISSAHQRGLYRGPTVLSWYAPLSGEPKAARMTAQTLGSEAIAQRVLTELRRLHPGSDALIGDVRTWVWGHGTCRPVVGLHQAPLDVPLLGERVFLAHTELSGMSLFEEASYHGVRAAEQALSLTGTTVESLL